MPCHGDGVPVTAAFSRLVTSPLGAALAAPVAVLAWLLGRRPLHPVGVTVDGVMVGAGGQEALPPGRTAVVARISLGVGLPKGWPDVFGVAWRWYDDDGRPQDLLLSSAGPGRIGRFVPLPRRTMPGWFTTVMPLRTPAGPVLLALVPADPPTQAGDVVLDILRATPRGPWARAGELRLRRPAPSAGRSAPSAGKPMPSAGKHADDRAPLRFDPTRNAPHGLSTYGWEDGLRSLAYAAARRAAPRAP